MTGVAGGKDPERAAGFHKSNGFRPNPFAPAGDMEERSGMQNFSERHGLDLPDVDIIIRQEAPDWLRHMVLSLAYEAGMQPSTLRTILCEQLMESPDPGNWSEYPNVDCEVHGLIERAPWFFVYDLMEVIHARLSRNHGYDLACAASFAEKLNRVFRKKGVGWQLVDGVIQVRGPEIFEHSLRTAVELAAATSRDVARRELHEALRDVTDQPNLTLGE